MEGMLNDEVRRTQSRNLAKVRICRGLPGLAEFDDNREVIRPGDGLHKVAAVCLPRPKWMSVGGRRLWSLGILFALSLKATQMLRRTEQLNARL
jgi:hypothetical protein